MNQEFATETTINISALANRPLSVRDIEKGISGMAQVWEHDRRGRLVFSYEEREALAIDIYSALPVEKRA